MELLYDTSNGLFRDSVDGSKKLAKTKDTALDRFTTSLEKSYMCPAGTVHNLFDSATEEMTVVLRLFNVQLQPFGVKGAKFSPRE